MSLFSQPLPVGSDAPPFLLPDENGDVFILNQQRHRNVVLVFYPGDDTPVCTSQLCDFRDNWARLQARDVLVYGINPSDAASHAAFRKKHDYPFPLLVDNGKRVARLYNAGGLMISRTVYAIAKGGKIVLAKRGKPAVDEILAALPA